jgi:hypothetical protein
MFTPDGSLDSKRRHDVLIDGEMFKLPRLKTDNTPGQVQKMKNDKHRQNYTAPAHHSGRGGARPKLMRVS